VRAALVVNPFATRVSEERLAEVREELERVTELDVVLTERPGHATELVTAACRGGADVVVVFSGDGVFNEALNGLERDVPIGFLPGGGTSVLPRALGLPRDPVAAARQLADALRVGRTRRISLGRVNGRRFSFAAGVGFPLEVVGLGRAAAAFVANGRPYTYAGRLQLPIARDASFERGLDVVAPVAVTPVAVPATVARVLSGRVGGAMYLQGHDLDRVKITCDVPLPLHVDGEDLGEVEHAVFEAERAAVSVLA